MSTAEIIVIIACVLFVAFVLTKSIIDRKNGKTCSGDCSSCSFCNIKIKEKKMDKYLKCESCGA
ncbi:MAG: FeoB-associated Cys-rich membrane protein, partial [Firmicutes bacterium]|nr:FeoB-associated Cys-rich membrane protein [Candidatus Caballimonas caccae]